MSEPAASVAVSDQMPVLLERSVPLATGETAKVHSLQVRDVLRIITALKKVGFKAIPAGLTVFDFATVEQRDTFNATKDPEEKQQIVKDLFDSLTVGDRLLIEQRMQEKMEAIFHWVAGSEHLAPVLISAVSDLSEEKVGSLHLVDGFTILESAFALIDVKGTVAAFLGFIVKTGALMDEIGRQSKNMPGLGKADKEGETSAQ